MLTTLAHLHCRGASGNTIAYNIYYMFNKCCVLCALVCVLQNTMYGVRRTLSFLGVLVLVCESTFTPTIRLSPIPPSSDNKKTLLCEVEVAGSPGSRVPVLNAQFYLNGSDVIDQLTRSEYELSNGEITFELSQDLEGYYTCGNDTYTSSEDHAQILVCKHLAIMQYFASYAFTFFLYE